jgi:hypothetical protein
MKTGGFFSGIKQPEREADHLFAAPNKVEFYAYLLKSYWHGTEAQG